MSKLYVKRRYGQTPNEILNSTELSFKAKGLFGYLQSKPDGWKFSVERIALQAKEGKTAIREGLKELEQAGWIRKVPQEQGKDGRFMETTYELELPTDRHIRWFSPEDRMTTCPFKISSDDGGRK